MLGLPSRDRYQRIAARLLRPAAPRQSDAIAIVRRCATPAAAWRALVDRGLAPRDAGRRRFRTVERRTCPRCHGKGRVGGYSGDPDDWEDNAWTCGTCDSQGAIPGRETDHDAPPTIDACLALASDPDGIAAAEAHAEEALARLAPWRSAAGGGVIWRIGGPLRDTRWALCEELRLFDFLQHGEARVWESPAHTAFAARAHDAGKGAFWVLAQRHACGDQFWRSAAERGERAPLERSGVLDEVLRPPPAVAGRPFAEIPNPFEPLLAIWELGYVPADFTGGSAVLIVPKAP